MLSELTCLEEACSGNFKHNELALISCGSDGHLLNELRMAKQVVTVLMSTSLMYDCHLL